MSCTEEESASFPRELVGIIGEMVFDLDIKTFAGRRAVFPLEGLGEHCFSWPIHTHCVLSVTCLPPHLPTAPPAVFPLICHSARLSFSDTHCREDGCHASRVHTVFAQPPLASRAQHVVASCLTQDLACSRCSGSAS